LEKLYRKLLVDIKHQSGKLPEDINTTFTKGKEAILCGGDETEIKKPGPPTQVF
jgi:hypothetical protein